MHGDAGVPGHGPVPPPPAQGGWPGPPPPGQQAWAAPPPPGAWAGPPPRTAGPLRWIVAAAAVVAAVLAVVGGLLPITETRPRASTGSALAAGRTGWATYQTGLPASALTQSAPLDGLLPAVAAALLLVAAGLALVGRHRAFALAGGTLLVGSVASVFIHLLPTKEFFERPRSGLGDIVAVDIGAGTWLLLVAGVVGLLIVVLVALPDRARPRAAAPPWPPAGPPPPGWAPPPGPPFPGPPPGPAGT